MGGSSKAYVVPVAIGIALALAGRALELVSGRRRFPTHPHGEVIHFFLGFVAGVLGSMAVASILTANYTAGVFLAIGAQQFHSVRGQERATLGRLDDESPVPRGKAYIEDLTMTFEARNFLLFGVAMVATFVAIRLGPWAGVVAGAGALAVVQAAFRGRRLGRIADVDVSAGRDGDGPILDIEIRPRGARAASVLRDPGQRQALVHDLHAIVGSRVGADGAERRPHARVDPDTGALRLRLWPVEPDVGVARRAVAHLPVLEAVAAPIGVGRGGRRT